MLGSVLRLFVALIACAFVVLAKPDSCAQYDKINVFIGTGGFAYGSGAINPAAQVPHGALRLGPDTMTTTADIHFQHFSGYYYPDDIVRAFSHTHTVGAGVPDWGTIGVMPIRLTKEGRLPTFSLPSPAGDFRSRFWWSTFNKSTEFASPGRYGVHLDKPSVDVDLLAIGTHAGIHHYVWKADGSAAVLNPGLILDMCHYATLSENIISDSHCAQANIAIDESGESFSGSVLVTGSLSHAVWVHIYGQLKSNRPTEGKADISKGWRVCTGLTADCKESNSGTATDGILYAIGLLGTTHAKSDFELQIAVGISFLDVEHAKGNLMKSLNNHKSIADFDLLAASTRSQWCDILSTMDVTALPDDSDLEIMLYSALYRSHMSPTSYTEHDGQYFATDQSAHNVTSERIQLYGDHVSESPLSYNFYSDLSFWDTFRTVHPWLLLVDEDLAIGIARSTSEITSMQGAFPRWMMASTESSCMIGNSGSALVLEAIDAGFGKEFDVKVIQQALQKQSTQPVNINGRSDVEFYIANGYVSIEGSGVAPSQTMTNAYDDWILAGISAYTGNSEDAAAALNRSTNYKNVFSAEHEYICPRSKSGEWMCVDQPQEYRYWGSYTEGNSLHWTYFAPHDPKGLISLFKSPESFDAHLDEFMFKSAKFTEEFGSPAPNQYFWAGNEHDAFAPWLFNYGPNCTKTQFYTRQVTHLSFSNTPHGVPGNEDYGAMATWLAFASLGIFPQAGTNTFLIGSPRVDRASLKLKNYRGGRYSTLDIVTYDNSAENVYVNKLLVNGVEHTSAFIDRAVLTSSKGCKLEFYMSNVPTSNLC